MDRFSFCIALTAVAALAGLTAGCGDPVIVLGDQPGTLRVVAGVPDTSGARTDPVATRSLLNTPRGLAVDADGVVYIGLRLGRIVSVNSAGELRQLRAAGGCTSQPCLQRGDALALDGAGGLLIADGLTNTIWRMDLSSRQLSLFAGTGVGGSSPDGTPAREAALASPMGIAVAPDGRVFFSEHEGYRVRTIDADGTLRTIAGTGALGFGGDGGAATEALLALPLGIELHGETLYIADSGNHRIRAVSLATGEISTVAGSGTAAFSGDGGPATAAALFQPADLAVSPDGRTLYIADTRNHRIRTVHLPTGVIDTFAGTGSTAFSGNLLPGSQTSFNRPSGLVVSPHQLLFIADSDHHIVWRVATRV